MPSLLSAASSAATQRSTTNTTNLTSSNISNFSTISSATPFQQQQQSHSSNSDVSANRQVPSPYSTASPVTVEYPNPNSVQGLTTQQRQPVQQQPGAEEGVSAGSMINTSMTTPAAGVFGRSVAAGNITAPTTVSATAAVINGAAGSVPAGSALAVARTNLSQPALSGETVSPSYIEFLRQQQDLVKIHCAIDDIVQAVVEFDAKKRHEHVEYLEKAFSLLQVAEGSTDWNWKSKFNIDTLVKDAKLEVPLARISSAEVLPNVTPLQHQQQLLVKLKQQYCGTEIDNPFSLAADLKSTLENGIRRFDRLIKEYTNSQLDSTGLVSTGNDFVVQLDHVLSQRKLAGILQELNDRQLIVTEKHAECAGSRDKAHEEGFMDVVEAESYRLVDLGEELTNVQIEKIRLLSRLLDEVLVNLEVKETNSKKTNDAICALIEESNDLKKACETDLARIFQLKQSVDEAEKAFLEATRRDRQASDQKLKDITSRQSEVWDQIATLLKVMNQLESDRHIEVKKRMEDKLRDESRQIEYTRFKRISEEQAGNYDRTIKNCDTQIHCAKLMSEFLNNGYFLIEKGLKGREGELRDALLKAQKGHFEAFRTLLLSLGDLEYRKERKMEEIGENIQLAHIQQEMCNDSLNPNAKKFSETKKELLKLRDDIHLELTDLRDRETSAAEQYKPTEEALLAANVPHMHPIEELEERRLNARAKMIEFKAFALGRTSSQPVKNELDYLKQGLQETRRVISKGSMLSLE